jgi:hypothetical protein
MTTENIQGSDKSRCQLDAERVLETFAKRLLNASCINAFSHYLSYIATPLINKAIENPYSMRLFVYWCNNALLRVNLSMI